jgi:hypothetical protein
MKAFQLMQLQQQIQAQRVEDEDIPKGKQISREEAIKAFKVKIDDTMSRMDDMMK